MLSVLLVITYIIVGLVSLMFFGGADDSLSWVSILAAILWPISWFCVLLIIIFDK